MILTVRLKVNKFFNNLIIVEIGNNYYTQVHTLNYY